MKMCGENFASYYQNVLKILDEVYESERDKIIHAGCLLADTIERDGLIHVFGCGHSHMVSEELFYRAGGLAAIDPLFEQSTMLHDGAYKSSHIERMAGYASDMVGRYPIQEGDTFIVTSSSGINSFPIEAADAARKCGATVIGITSSAYDQEPSRDHQGRHLKDVCDLWIDNHVPHGDAVISLYGETKAGPVSSISGFFIANSMVLEACEELQRRGIEPGVFASGNVTGGELRNTALIQKYIHRVKHL